jgi:hypothetical protein
MEEVKAGPSLWFVGTAFSLLWFGLGYLVARFLSLRAERTAALQSRTSSGKEPVPSQMKEVDQALRLIRSNVEDLARKVGALDRISQATERSAVMITDVRHALETLGEELRLTNRQLEDLATARARGFQSGLVRQESAGGSTSGAAFPSVAPSPSAIELLQQNPVLFRTRYHAEPASCQKPPDATGQPLLCRHDAGRFFVFKDDSSRTLVVPDLERGITLSFYNEGGLKSLFECNEFTEERHGAMIRIVAAAEVQIDGPERWRLVQRGKIFISTP